jgi:hypothetical protein
MSLHFMTVFVCFLPSACLSEDEGQTTRSRVFRALKLPVGSLFPVQSVKGNDMKPILKTIAVVALALSSSVVFAAGGNANTSAATMGSGSSKVSVGAVRQTQSGTDNRQELDVGNAKNGGSSTVTGYRGAINQTQGGSSNVQTTKVGNANGGTSNVTVTGKINQNQDGSLNRQELFIGNVTKGGASNVIVHGTLTQSQTGSSNQQTARIGNANAGAARVNLGSLNQTQTGTTNNQTARIGNVGADFDD